VTLTGSPGNRIYLRGKYLGYIPLRTQIPAGRHEFQVVGEAEFFKVTRVVQMSGDENPALIELTP